MKKLLIAIAIILSSTQVFAKDECPRGKVCGAEGKGGGFPYYQSKVYQIIKASQTSVIFKLKKWDEKTFNAMTAQEFAHPMNLTELLDILNHIQLQPAHEDTAVNPYGIEEPLSMHYGVDNSGQKYLIAYGRLFDYVKEECWPHEYIDPTNQVPTMESCRGLEAKFLHEAFHFFGYNEDEAENAEKIMMEILDGGPDLVNDFVHYKDTSLFNQEAIDQINAWAFEGKTFPRRIKVMSGQCKDYIVLDLTTPRKVEFVWPKNEETTESEDNNYFSCVWARFENDPASTVLGVIFGTGYDIGVNTQDFPTELPNVSQDEKEVTFTSDPKTNTGNVLARGKKIPFAQSKLTSIGSKIVIKRFTEKAYRFNFGGFVTFKNPTKRDRTTLLYSRNNFSINIVVKP